jgi:hypothetical protein
MHVQACVSVFDSVEVLQCPYSKLDVLLSSVTLVGCWEVDHNHI